MSSILVPNDVLDTPEEPLHPPLHGAAGPHDDHRHPHQEGEEEIQQEEDPPYHGGSHEQLPLPPDSDEFHGDSDILPVSVGPRIAQDQPMPVEELTEITVNSEENGRALGIGTFGYDAPEYAAAMNADRAVCSLSVVLLKLLVGKKAVDHILASGLQSLVSWGIPKDMHCVEEKLGGRGGGDCPTKACCNVCAI
ncbi:hypothetical protein PIB30_079952 [Stylosanthes scabra]|uniref:Uncharacterized protein n=1 Tax=Stylosanthes scabra TaxID=79078 RepID=A0ABU6VSG9_9FABA|nr:hypothetical protein [Stylosanthes scabra]